MTTTKENNLIQINKETRIVDSKKNNIFAFWESDSEMPAYLKLCIQTWYKNIPNSSIHIINYNNLEDYIGSTYKIELLKKIPLPMQSDIISVAILEKFGGLFLDIDCIVTHNLFEIFDAISLDKLIAFGNIHREIHLAVLYCRSPNNKLIKNWREKAQEKLLSKIPDKLNWNHFGNSIIDPLLNEPKYYDDYHIIERSISGNILEVSMLEDYEITNWTKYRLFYFNTFFKLNKDILNHVKCGVISLHNSWTPREIKIIKNIDEIYSMRMPFIDLIKYSLSDDLNAYPYNSIIMVEVKIEKELFIREIVFRKSYYKNMLVLDFEVNGIKFAFDVFEENNLLEAFLVLRNKGDIEKYKKLSFFHFEENKAALGLLESYEELLMNILIIYNYYSNQFK